MSEIKLTVAQQAVVDNRGGPLLVSAAAGSGKTKVLVDRILSQICQPDHPCNIDDFLVITYTNAAAAELRLKIAQALNSRLAKEPDNRHLQKQLRRIYLADISTVHAFCSNLIRTYAYLVDVPADFRMAEEVESTMLQEKVLEKLLEQSYADASEDFLLMVDMFGYGRDDRRLPDAIQMAYSAMRCRVDMDQWLDDMIKIMDVSDDQDVSETPWGRYLLQEFHEFLSRQIQNMKTGLKDMQFFPKIQKGLETIFEQNIEQMQDLLQCSTWDELAEHKIVSFGKAGVIRSPEDSAVKERLTKIRKQCWAELKNWQNCFAGTSDEILSNLKQMMPAAQALLRFTKEFDRAYAAEKRHRKLMDFSDLEHTAIKLLVDRYTKQPTKVAREISRKYVEIMVDEYQDSNQVQEVIFDAVSRNGINRFMVGDIKQSIYRFRLADPSLFLKKYNSYAQYIDAAEGEPRKILLSQNFRSRPEILSACNDVFKLIMRKSVGDLDYGEAEALYPGRKFPPVSEPPVELHCLTSTSEETGMDKRELEARFVAKRIRQLLDQPMMLPDGEGARPIRPDDIVILMRSLSSTVPTYLKILEEHGIRAICSREGSLLETTEIQVLVALLQVIDNPHRDVPLLTALASPVFGFTPEQLAQARAKNKRLDVYDAIKGSDIPSFHAFITKLEQLRQDAQWLALHDLLDRIFEETELYSVFSSMTDGETRSKNLDAFRSFVVSFENGATRSLAELLWYLNDLQSKGGDIPVPGNTAENAVTIMSVHKSKGLEFPVVFLSDLSHQFSRKDTQEAILVDDQLAVGCNYIDQQRYVRYPTIAKQSIERKKKKEAISEELRILYVAMTRAKDKLIMTYYSKHLVKELDNLNSQLTIPLSDDLCGGVNNPGKWILMAALCRTEAGALLNLVGGNEVSQVSDDPWKIAYHDLMQEEDAAVPEQEETEPEAFRDDPAVLQLIQYQYPHIDVSSIPSKLTATTLKGRFQDQEAAEHAAEAVSHRAPYRFKRLEFAEKKLTATEKGIATHLFMQYSNYRQCTTSDGIASELQRMTNDFFLTSEQADAVQTEQILYLFTSPFGQWLLNQKHVEREFKFSLFVDAGIYNKKVAGEKIMLQGVVDCFVIEEDGITILDFKTDRVNGPLESYAERYRSQICAYADALSQIYKLPIKKKYLYFFSKNQELEIL